MQYHDPEKEMAWRILSADQLGNLIPLSRSTIWRMERRGDFPKRFAITPGRVGWNEKEVQSWIKSRVTRSEAFDPDKIDSCTETK